MEGLPPQALEQVAAYFQALSEPTRLQILNLLRREPRNVGDLARLCACSAANVSRHLALLAQQGFVRRETRGNSVWYHIADPAIYQLCDLVCGAIARQVDQAAERMAEQRAAFTPPAGPTLPAEPAARPTATPSAAPAPALPTSPAAGLRRVKRRA